MLGCVRRNSATDRMVIEVRLPIMLDVFMPCTCSLQLMFRPLLMMVASQTERIEVRMGMRHLKAILLLLMMCCRLVWYGWNSVIRPVAFRTEFFVCSVVSRNSAISFSLKTIGFSDEKAMPAFCRQRVRFETLRIIFDIAFLCSLMIG